MILALATGSPASFTTRPLMTRSLDLPIGCPIETSSDAIMTKTIEYMIFAPSDVRFSRDAHFDDETAELV